MDFNYCKQEQYERLYLKKKLVPAHSWNTVTHAVDGRWHVTSARVSSMNIGLLSQGLYNNKHDDSRLALLIFDIAGSPKQVWLLL